MPLTQQIRTFRSADLIVAQHGAALTNMVWCTPATSIIEISPNDKDFSDLAAAFGLRYNRIKQQGEHSPVEPADVVSLALHELKLL
jgi:capsular polysaccharide biosynthesis protein